MSGFISLPPAPGSPEASVVEAGDFWPAIDVNGVRNSVRLGDSTVAHERLVSEIEGALADLLGQLADWQALQIAAGAATLDQVETAQSIGGRSIAEVLWERAVRYHTAAALADSHTDISATDAGAARGAEKRVIADDYRRMATTALRQLRALGQQAADGPPRTGGVLVDLI